MQDRPEKSKTTMFFLPIYSGDASVPIKGVLQYEESHPQSLSLSLYVRSLVSVTTPKSYISRSVFRRPREKPTFGE
jgi:hypothetical protein